MFQSLSRDSGRLNDPVENPVLSTQPFQSLSRDSGRLNCDIGFNTLDLFAGFNPSVGIRGV